MISKAASLSRQEQERRHRVLREAMAEAGIDALLMASLGHHNQRGPVRYVSNWRSPTFSDYVLLPMRGEMTLCTHYPKYVALAREHCGVESAVATPYGQEDANVIAGVVADWGIKRLGLVSPATMSARFHQTLLAALPKGIETVDAADLFESVRSIKSEEEIALIREAARLGDLAFDTFREALRPGRKEYEVLADVEHALRSRGAEEVFFIVGSGERPVNRFWDMADRTLAPGDAVIFCIELCASGGYWTQFVRTVTLGPARDAVRRNYGVLREALRRAEETLRPGVPACEVARAITAVVASAGLKEGNHPGHGQGLDIVENPFLGPTDKTPLAAGMHIILHPHVAFPEGGGLWVGDPYLVTPSGAVRLSVSSQDLAEV
ncbi:MAG: aminopeptidase P family protein [Candidatus Tectomicrobia bacterium]|nr:aminopeptidase P family protein [Candidatus Tectomicrobia bacterium]